MIALISFMNNVNRSHSIIPLPPEKAEGGWVTCKNTTALLKFQAKWYNSTEMTLGTYRMTHKSVASVAM